MDNMCRLPRSVYYQVLWTIKDIERLRRLEAFGHYDGKSNEMVFFVDEGEVIGNPEVLEEAAWKMQCIRNALDMIPEEFRRNTLDNIVYSVPYSNLADENTWHRWRRVFIRELAKNLYLI